MKAIITQNLTKNITAREVVIMNLISNIIIKDQDIKKSNVNNKRINSKQDHGLSLYNRLEFSRDNSSKASHTRQYEMICNRLA